MLILFCIFNVLFIISYILAKDINRDNLYILKFIQLNLVYQIYHAYSTNKIICLKNKASHKQFYCISFYLIFDIESLPICLNH